MNVLLGGLKFVLKAAAALLVFAVCAFAFIVFFGSWEERYKCTGKLETTDGSTPATVFLKLKLYRSWLFWADDDGMVWSETTGSDLDYFSDVRVIGDFIHFIDPVSGRSGSLSTLSYHLGLGGRGKNFEGDCKRIANGG